MPATRRDTVAATFSIKVHTVMTLLARPCLGFWPTAERIITTNQQAACPTGANCSPTW